MDYIYIDKEVLYSKDLSSTAKLLYIYLRKHSENGCCQSMTMEKMEEKLGISRKTISTAVKELSDNYFMKVESPGMNRQNIYRFPFLNDTNEIKADMEIIKDTTLSKSDKIIYLVISSSFNELSRQEIVDLTGISLSSVKTSVKSLCDKKMIIEETKGKKSVYKKTNIKDTTDTEDMIRQAVEKWLGIKYFTQSTSCFAEAARQIRDAVVNDQALKRKKDPPLFDIYCKDIYDPESIISAYILDKKHLNCNSFLREKARNKELKFFLKSDDKDSPKIKMCNSLKNTSYNYFFDHEKIMVYAKVKEICDDHYRMSNLLDPAEEFHTEKNGINLKVNDTCRLFLGHPDNEVYPLLYGEKIDLPPDLKSKESEKCIKFQDKDFLTVSSSKNKLKGEMKLKGIAFIRKYELLLPYKTTLILDGDHFPKDYPLPKKGVMLNFDVPKKSSDKVTNNYIPNYFVKKDGTGIFVTFIKFLMPTSKSKRAFLQHIIELEEDKASKLEENGFPELSESNYDREKIKSIFANEKISLSASDVELYTDRCTMLTKPDELKKLLKEGFYYPPDDKLPKILANLLSNYSNYFIKKYSANTTNELQILLGKGIYKPLDDKSPKELAKSMTELLAKLLAKYNYIHIEKYSADVVNELKELLSKGFSEPLDDKSPKLLVKLLAGLLAKLLEELLEEYYDILFNRYSIDALYKLKQNPYILLDDTDDTTPFVCDRIAKFIGMKYNEPVRLCSLIRYIFSSVLSGGDIGIYTNELTEKFVKYKEVFDKYPTKEELLRVINNDMKEKLLYLEEKDIIVDKTMYENENEIVRQLNRIKTAKIAPLDFDKGKLDAVLKELGMTDISEDKYKAIINISSNNISLITGGAGTGKSTLITIIRRLCETYGKLKIEVCAPTGKAANNIENGSTVNSLLNYNPFKGNPTKNQIDADIVLLDEASMLDTDLAVEFLTSIKSGSRLIMVGDKNQLPPVDGGQVFADMLNSECFACCTLETIHRQEKESSIITNSQKIIRGETDFICDDSFRIIKCKDEDIMKKTLIDEVSALFDKNDPFAVQIIAPYNNGKTGVNSLNYALQKVLNDNKQETKIGMMVFRKGDKVVFSKSRFFNKDNKKDDKEDGERITRYTNGQTGTIIEAVQHPRTIEVKKSDEKVSKLRYNDIVSGDVSLAYAMTIHKSQGSQFNDVFVVLPKRNNDFVSRSLLYTAVTRVKKRITILYSGDEVKNAVLRDKSRLTFLKEKIENEIGGNHDNIE